MLTAAMAKVMVGRIKVLAALSCYEWLLRDIVQNRRAKVQLPFYRRLEVREVLAFAAIALSKNHILKVCKTYLTRMQFGE